MRIFNATIQDRTGNIQPGATITVRDEATSNLITLYDIDDNLIGNPFTVGASGLCQFKILDDRYVFVLAEFGGESQEWRFIPLFEIDDIKDDITTLDTTFSGQINILNARYPAGQVIPNMFTQDPATLGIRQVNFIGQVVEIADYQEACDNLYVGDANNATAPAFYKTSDSGGVTRSTSGAYMVFPDTRGLSLKHIGNATISGRVKTGPVSLGEAQEDGVQDHLHLYGVNHTAEGGATTANQLVKSGGGGDVAQDHFTLGGAERAGFGVPRLFAHTRDSTMGAKFGVTY